VRTAAVTIAFIVPIAIAAMWGATHSLSTVATIALYAGALVAVFGAVFGAFYAVARVLGAIQLVLLRRLGDRLDRDAYLGMLGRAPAGSRLHVRLSFAAAWPDDTRGDVVDAVRHWMPRLEHVAWDGDVLDLRHQPVETSTLLVETGMIATRDRSQRSNRYIHGAFRRVVRRVIRRRDDRARIAKIDVTVVE
jgi:hypothetical protein